MDNYLIMYKIKTNKTHEYYTVPDTDPWQQAKPVTAVPAALFLHTVCPSQMPVSPRTQSGTQHHLQYSSNTGTALDHQQPVTYDIMDQK